MTGQGWLPGPPETQEFALAPLEQLSAAGIRGETRHFGRLAAAVADSALTAALVAHIRAGVAPQDRRAWLILDSYHSAVGAPARDRKPLGRPRQRS
ncbi:hypothetical protein GCM10025789_13010 [Tessaracoccus lubricantis]|uniref:Transposase IS701-like DDE domain-containing protein n=1 Tax=Tessaracoccus lubricantis TaxID=545543 RepID=A0ABP9F8B5_9ACTN